MLIFTFHTLLHIFSLNRCSLLIFIPLFGCVCEKLFSRLSKMILRFSEISILIFNILLVPKAQNEFSKTSMLPFLNWYAFQICFQIELWPFMVMKFGHDFLWSSLIMENFIQIKLGSGSSLHVYFQVLKSYFFQVIAYLNVLFCTFEIDLQIKIRRWHV